MNSLMLILVLLCIICLIVGIIKPNIVIRWGDLEKRNRKNVFKYYGLGLIVAFILFGISTPKTVSTSTGNNQAEQEAKKAVEEKGSYNTGITYNQLARTPDDYENEKVKFTGEVIQVIEGEKCNNLRVAVNDNHDDIVFVEYNPSILKFRILEDDNITLYGISRGIHTYKSTLGGNISIPGIHANNIEMSN